MLKNKNTIYILAIINFVAITTCIYFLLIEEKLIWRKILTFALSIAIFFGNIYGGEHLQKAKRNLSKNLNIHTLTIKNLSERKKLQVIYLILHCSYLFVVSINWYAAIFFLSLLTTNTPETITEVFSISNSFFYLWEQNILSAFLMTIAVIIIALTPQIIRSFLGVNNT